MHVRSTVCRLVAMRAHASPWPYLRRSVLDWLPLPSAPWLAAMPLNSDGRLSPPPSPVSAAKMDDLRRSGCGLPSPPPAEGVSASSLGVWSAGATSSLLCHACSGVLVCCFDFGAPPRRVLGLAPPTVPAR